MGKTIPISLLCLLFTVAYGQDTCNHAAFHPIDIVSDPYFANSPTPCVSGFAPSFTWYRYSDEMLTGFLYPCDNYVIPDSAYGNHSFSDPNIYFFPSVPRPVPGGQGVAGVTDFGFDGAVHVYYGHKSYVSTCLEAPLQKDSLYRLDFYAGFGGKTRHSPLPVHNAVLVPEYSVSPEVFALFGLPGCSQIATPLPLIGCPAVGGWVTLGAVKVESDTGRWTKVSISFRPSTDIRAIALGPSCDSTLRTAAQEVAYPYDGETIIANQFSYFLTGLQFYQATAPPPVVSIVSGDSCSPAIVLQVQPADFYNDAVFQWYRNDTTLNGETGKTITLAHAGYRSADYRCRIKNDSVCLVSDAFPVDWLPIPSSSALGAADTSVCTGDTMVLGVADDPSFSYRWQDGSTLSYLRVWESGTSVVTITNTCGTAAAEKTVYFGKCDLNVYIPNGFTPNGDGHNDLLRAHFFYPPSGFSMHIFNRNGLEVFATNDAVRGWDGRYDGRPQPAGAYIWEVDYRDMKGGGHMLRGTTVLIR
jgi:gliding motility-associated-like protein